MAVRVAIPNEVSPKELILEFRSAELSRSLIVMSQRSPLPRAQVWLLWTVSVLGIIFTLLFTIVFVVLPALGLAGSFRIPSDGMAPAIQSGDHLYARLQDGYTPERREVVLFDPPAHPTTSSAPSGPWIQRCVGVPGDQLEVVNEWVAINGENVAPVAPDGYANPPFTAELGSPTTIPPDSYFLVGDNLDDSLDSRFFGFVSRDQIEGVVKWRVLPIPRAGPVR